MTKTSSTRFKGQTSSSSEKGSVLLYTGILTICVAVALFIIWIFTPGFFALYIVPIMVIFIPLVIYASVALSLYNMKYKTK